MPILPCTSETSFLMPRSFQRVVDPGVEEAPLDHFRQGPRDFLRTALVTRSGCRARVALQQAHEHQRGRWDVEGVSPLDGLEEHRRRREEHGPGEVTVGADLRIERRCVGPDPEYADLYGMQLDEGVHPLAKALAV